MSARTTSGRSTTDILRSPFAVVVVLVVTWFIVAFLVSPNVNLLGETFFPDGELSLRAFERLISSERAVRSLINSALLAVALSISTNVVGLFIVLVTAYFRIWGSRFLFLSYATTLIYGGIVLAAAWRFIYGRGGIVTEPLTRLFAGLDPDWFSGFFAVLVVMTLATTTNHLLFLTVALSKTDLQTIEAAKNLGAGTWTILWRVVLPMVKPMIFAITVLSFLAGLGALSAPQVLGGRDFQTITPMILTFASSPTSRDLAALLAVLLGAATLLVLAVLMRLERGGTYFSLSKVATRMSKQRIENPVANALVHIVAYVLAVLYLVPVVLIVLYSFMPPAAIETASFAFSQMSFDNYVRVLTQGNSLRPFVISVLYSLFAAGVSVIGLLLITRVIVRYRGWLSTSLEYLLHIPWVLPPAMIALGLIMSFDQPNWMVGGNVLTGTIMILGVAFVIVKIPFTLRLLKAAYASIDQQLEEAAGLLGAGTWTILRRIVMPAVLPTAAAIFALNFNSLLDDYDTAVFLAHPLYQPLGLVIQANATGEVDINARANTFVYTVLLMIITGLTMYFIYGRVAGGKKRRRRSRTIVESPRKETVQ